MKGFLLLFADRYYILCVFIKIKEQKYMNIQKYDIMNRIIINKDKMNYSKSLLMLVLVGLFSMWLMKESNKK